MHAGDWEAQPTGASGIGASARRVREDLRALGRAIAEQRDDWTTALERALNARPLATVALAFGAGFVLGGGLFSRTASRLVGFGVRMAGLAIAHDFLGDLETSSLLGMANGVASKAGASVAPIGPDAT